MKIAIVGAHGNLGTHMVQEALRRQHHVTAASRSGHSVEGLPGTVLDLADTEALVRLVNEHDVTVISVPGHETDHQNLIAAHPQGRIMSVGGAGTLVDEQGNLGLDSPHFPAEFRPDSLQALHVLDAYRASDLNWTVICPPSVIEEGERTGAYVEGLDSLAGFRISRADFAIAVIDEAENGRHQRERFTVATS